MKKIEKLRQSDIMFDAYSGFLSADQREAFVDYYHNDYSICEIAKKRGVSRQFISELLKNIEAIFNNLEDKLGLIKKSNKAEKLINSLMVDIRDLSISESVKKRICNKIVQLSKV